MTIVIVSKRTGLKTAKLRRHRSKIRRINNRPLHAKNSKTSAEEFYRSVAARYAGQSDAGPARGFGSNAPKVNGKFFASLTKGRLLSKLPEARVDALVKAKKADRFSTGVGRVKKEWATVAPSTETEWLALAEEARAYVKAQTA
jgi:hypothetical protein